MEINQCRHCALFCDHELIEQFLSSCIVLVFLGHLFYCTSIKEFATVRLKLSENRSCKQFWVSKFLHAMAVVFKHYGLVNGLKDSNVMV